MKDEKLQSFVFSIGGLLNTSHHIFFDCLSGNKVIRYKHTEFGNNADLTENIELGENECNNFIKDIEECRINTWNGDYYNLNILDGLQWRLEIKYEGGEIISKSGSNAYPENWNQFLSVIKKYIKKDSF